MRYTPIDATLFIHNRQHLYKLLKPNALVILHSHDIMPTSGDGLMAFKQNSDLFYLSGIEQEETILVLYPSASESCYQEMLFLKPTNDQIKIWEGEKLLPHQACQISGIENVYWLDAFPDILHKLMCQAQYVYLNTNEHPRAIIKVETQDMRFIRSCQNQYPLHTYERLAPLMKNLRSIKSPIELDLIKQACAITERGFRRILPKIKPGIREYAIEAELIAEFIAHGSRGFAYQPIIASGAKSCILHYQVNNQICQAGDLILLDVGAEYANYNADLTRVVPVNGQFTSRQKAVYNSVLSVLKQAKQLLVPGNTWLNYQKEIGQIMEKELLGLGLLDKKDIQNQNAKHPAYKKYFMHGISHAIGLDVHDLTDVSKRFEPGMVFTVEPGIYIPKEGFGIRLENNVVMTSTGVADLMEKIPIEAEEIEDLMHSH